jgi:hypothetical protein
MDESGTINPYAVAFIMTERTFRGPFFRWAELFYSFFSIFVFRIEPQITLGHCQVSFDYWRRYYGRDTFSLLLGTLSLRESYKICCIYLHANRRDSLRETVVAYNGRPSNLYLERFLQHLQFVNQVGNYGNSPTALDWPRSETR